MGPGAIPASGWRDILWRTFRTAIDDRLLMVAAAITFYVVLALVPTLAAFVSIYGLVSDPASVPSQVETLRGIVPSATLEILRTQLERLSSQEPSGLSLTLMASLAIAIWSANAATRALIDGLNIVFSEDEKRSFVGLFAVSLTFTICGILMAAIFAGVSIALPAILALFPLSIDPPWLVTAASFAALAVVAALAIAALYRWGPSRATAKWRWVSPGAAVAVMLVLLTSYGFSVYASSFTDYDATYGSLGGLIAFLTWVWIVMSSILLGAELDAEIEHQTTRDSTTGAPKPLGARGAVMADTVGVTYDSGLAATDDAAARPTADDGGLRPAKAAAAGKARLMSDTNRPTRELAAFVTLAVAAFAVSMLARRR